MTDREHAILWLDIFMKNKEPLVLIPKPLIRLMYDVLKNEEAVEPYMDYDGHDVWRCGNCGATIFHIEHSQADEDLKSYAKFCRQCGKKVKWDDR